jgi:K+-transporting ATPase A subunit
MSTKTKLLIIALFPLIASLFVVSKPTITEVLAKPKQPKISLTSSNTPTQADYIVHWYREDIYATHRYTEFHYQYVTRDNVSHIVLANYGNGGLIENTQPLIYTYTLTFKASASSWSRIELRTSTDKINYETEASFVLNGNSKLTTLTTAKPYFTIQKVDGAMAKLEYLKISYDC